MEQLQLTFRAEPPSPPVRSGILAGWWMWCVAGLLIGMICWTAGRYYLASSLSDQLAQAQTRDEALIALEGLVLLDSEASLGIVRGLEHADPQVARAAHRALDERVTQWQQAGVEQSEQSFGDLLKRLVALPDSTPEHGMVLASGLAVRIHAICGDSSAADLNDLATLCEQVIRRAGEARLERLAASELGESSTKPESDPLDEVQRLQAQVDAFRVPPPLAPAAGTSISLSDGPFTEPGDAARSMSDNADLASEAGIGILPPLGQTGSIYSSAGAPTARVQLTASPTRPRSNDLVDEPNALRASASLSDLSGFQLGDDSPHDAFDAGAFNARYLDNTPATTEPAIVRGESTTLSNDSISRSNAMPARITETSSRMPATYAPADLEQMPIERLVRLLASRDGRTAQDAALALASQGMSDDRLALASELATCSTNRRMELLAEISSKTDLDPRPWLLWMAEDGEVEVRRQAVSLLHPMIDREVQRRLRNLLGRENDEDVAMHIRRLLMVSPGLPLQR